MMKKKNIDIVSTDDFPNVNDGFERLWTPHRVAYATGTTKHSAKNKNHICPFCNVKKNKENYVIYEGKYVSAVLNLFPYNTGHVLLSPYRHIPNFTNLNDNEILEIGKIKKSVIRTIEKVYNPDGFNFGMNNSGVAGAGIPDHVHEHIIPRWAGDTNFLPIIAKTRTVIELLNDTQKKIINNWVPIQ